MADGHGLRFSFRERMSGPFALGLDNPTIGAERGRAAGTTFVGDFTVTIDDLAACVAAPNHPARLGGTVSFDDLASGAPITDGALHLYAADPETGMKRMDYRADFRGRDGAAYRLVARKFIRPGRATIREQVTAYGRITKLEPDGQEPTVVAAGVLVFRVRDLPGFLWSMRAEGASRILGLRRFLGFARRELQTPVPVSPA
jgi:hypothetical protein